MSAVIPSSNTPAAARNGAARLVVPPALQQLWRWWRAELRLVFVPLVEKYWVDRSGTVDLTLAADGAIALPPRLNGRDVRLLVDWAHVLQKSVAYPAAVEESLAEVVMNDLDRQTPFTPEQIYLMHRVERRYEAADGVARLDVELTMVLRRVVASAVERVQGAGGAVYSAVITNPSSGASSELLPLAERAPRRLTRLQKMNLGLLGVLAVLVAAALGVPIAQRHAEVTELAPRGEKARNEAEATRKIEAEFQRLSQEYQLAMTRKYQAYAVVDIIEELTRLSPDTTWLQSLEMRAPSGASKANKSVREVQLIGEAASASKMIELLEQSPLLQNTTQRAQTTRGSQPNTERFQIATELKPRITPELIDLLAASPRATEKTAQSANPANATIAPPTATETAKVSKEKSVGADKGEDKRVLTPMPPMTPSAPGAAKMPVPSTASPLKLTP